MPCASLPQAGERVGERAAYRAGVVSCARPCRAYGAPSPDPFGATLSRWRERDFQGVGRQYLAAVEAFETLFVGMVMPTYSGRAVGWA
jgi:hypothetical protein